MGLFLPAAGYRNNSNLNNAGSNGNYWSSSLNTDNPNNAWNVNFNTDNYNMNNNNRNYGQSVRAVRSSRQHLPETSVFRLTRERLLADLRQAYYDARRHKRNKPYQLHFEAHLVENLESLCDALWKRTYQPLPSSCFIINDPKQREVFAADFRDRIVHHLYYNYTHQIFERTFIHDSYSCIKNRGTHYGIRRLEEHIRKESQNYTVPCYVMKMDIRGYFMHIDRKRLLEICLATIDKILTSQLFSNVYLNVLDQFMKRELKCRHYGRYVDDFYVVSADRKWLLSKVSKVKALLSERLRLAFHDGKLKLTSVWQGVEFLGAWLKPHRVYVSRNCMGRIGKKLDVLEKVSHESWYAALNSYCGILSHWSNYNVMRKLLIEWHNFTDYGIFDYGLRHFYD